jgi:hypothetical protein
MTRRLFVLFVCAFLSAIPLAWLSLDPNAGERLLKLMQLLQALL